LCGGALQLLDFIEMSRAGLFGLFRRCLRLLLLRGTGRLRGQRLQLAHQLRIEPHARVTLFVRPLDYDGLRERSGRLLPILQLRRCARLRDQVAQALQVFGAWARS